MGDKVVAKANALLAQANAPELPRELKSSKAGSLLNKVVAAGSAILQGTALLTLSQETREMDGGLILRGGATWRSTARLRPSCGCCGGAWRRR